MRFIQTALTYFFLGFLFCSNAWAATVRKYDSDKQLLWIHELNAKALEIQQQVCVYNSASQLVGCGHIVGLTRKAASVKMDDLQIEPNSGMTVTLRAETGRAVSSTGEVSDSFNASSSRILAISAGITAGLNYYYPTLHLQLALGRNFAIGLMPMYASYSANNNSTTGYGGYLTMSYYHTHSVFRGLEFELGAGAFGIEAEAGSLQQKETGIGGKATVGWRGKGLWDLGLDIGVAGGFQYVDLKTTVLDVSFRGFLPLIAAYIGYSF